MRTHRTIKTALLLTLCILLAGGLAQAQGPDDPDALQVEVALSPDMLEIPTEQADPDAAQLDEVDESALSAAPGSAMGTSLPFQGRLTNASGSPLNGTYSVRLALYDVSTGGTALCTDTDNTTVTNGLFVFMMEYCEAGDLDGRQLYLGVKVGDDAEMTPRQAIHAVPFARGLQPGAIINQTLNTDRGLTVRSNGGGSTGTTLWAENSNTTSGVAVWANSAGADAAIVAKNTGTGALFKGFGADGGEDEIRINNNGGIETKADSYIWIPGSALITNQDSDTTRWDVTVSGGVDIWRGAAAGSKTVHFPVTLPSVLYGKTVTIEEMTVWYRTSNASNAFITGTAMYKLTGASATVMMVNNATDRTSTTDATYTLPVANNELSTGQPGVGIYLSLAFANDTDHVTIGGIQLRLGHHSLY